MCGRYCASVYVNLRYARLSPRHAFIVINAVAPGETYDGFDTFKSLFTRVLDGECWPSYHNTSSIINYMIGMILALSPVWRQQFVKMLNKAFVNICILSFATPNLPIRDHYMATLRAQIRGRTQCRSDDRAARV
jgi:hypothetical protein